MKKEIDLSEEQWQYIEYKAKKLEVTIPELIWQAVKKPLRINKDENFIEELKKNPAYSHIDFDFELGQMQAWLSLPKNKNRKMIPSFVLNWLNKKERPIVVRGPERRIEQRKIERVFTDEEREENLRRVRQLLKGLK